MRTRGMVIPIDPQRATGWVLVELLVCLSRDVLCGARATHRGWQRAHRSRWFRIMRGIVVAGGLGLGGAAANQHFHLLRLLLSLTG